MDGVRVRVASVDDVAELTELRRSFTFEDATDRQAVRDDFEESFARIVGRGIASGHWVVWLAEVDGAIVSHVFVRAIEKIPRPTFELGAIGYVTNVYTRPEFRGRGIGRRVLDAVINWALEADVELLMVWPSETSVDHYTRHGFADRGEPLVWRRSGDPT